jgi:hypothetical protein
MKNLYFAIVIFILTALPSLAQKQMTDKGEEGLKGQVKTVTVELAQLSNVNGKWVEGKRYPASVDTYDLKGDLTQRDRIDYKGKPLDKSVYSYLDSERVVKIDLFEASFAIPGPPAPFAVSEAAKSNRDSRYTFKFKYIYDSEGRRVETDWYENDGRVFSRDFYEYDVNGHQVKHKSYGGDGSPGIEKTFLYDNKGNVKEAINHPPFGKDGRYSYEYKFDSTGNWIRRASSKWVTKDGKSYFEPFEITYRSITYY